MRLKKGRMKAIYKKEEHKSQTDLTLPFTNVC